MTIDAGYVRIVTVALIIAGSASPALPCKNVLPRSMAVEMVARAEQLLERDQPARAARVIEWWLAQPYIEEDPDGRLRQRLRDVHMIATVRVGDAHEPVAQFTEHARPDDPRVLAWLAEALAFEGKSDKAREILRGLRKRDLMPDAFAYRTLARLTTGEEADGALAGCRRRTKVKSICTSTPAKRP